MKILFAGTPAAAIPTLDSLSRSLENVVGVLTRPPARQGRKSMLVPSEVSKRASDLGISLVETSKPSDAVDELSSFSPDLGVVVAYGALLKPDVLALPKHGWINLHFSALPRWRGAAPVQHTIWNRDEFAATSVFQLEEGLDTGPVYSTWKVPLAGDETSGDLLERLAVLGARQVLEVVDLIAKGVTPTPQSDEGVTYAGRISREDAFIDFQGTAEAVSAHIRAVSPTPGAWTLFQGKPLKLGPVRIASEPFTGAPGTIGASKKDVVVACVGGAVRLGEVAPAGKRMMNAADWWRGTRLGSAIFGEGKSHE